MKLTLTLLSALLLAPLGALHAADAPKPKPNIVFILVDDMPYAGPSVTGNKLLQTPHMDRIAELISMAICLFLGWYAIGFVQSSMALGERGMAIPIKVWPIQTVLIWMFFSSAFRHATFAIWPALRPEAKGESH